jgi:hypothetical protein
VRGISDTPTMSWSSGVIGIGFLIPFGSFGAGASFADTAARTERRGNWRLQIGMRIDGEGVSRGRAAAGGGTRDEKEHSGDRAAIGFGFGVGKRMRIERIGGRLGESAASGLHSGCKRIWIYHIRIRYNFSDTN